MSRSFTFTLTPRKIAAVAVVALSLFMLGAGPGCSAQQKSNAVAGVSNALTGHVDPSSTQPATGTSIIGVTQGVADGAAAAASVPSPLSAPFALIAQLAGLAVLVERLAVYGTAAIKNCLSSPSGSTSASPTGSDSTLQPATGASGSGSPQSQPPASLPLPVPSSGH